MYIDNRKVSAAETGVDFFPELYCGRCDARFMEEVHLVAHEQENRHSRWSQNEDNVISDFDDIVRGTGT